MEKSWYKERFSFDDPLSLTSASRTTRYRTKKRRLTTVQSSEGAPGTFDHHLHAPPSGSAALESLNDDENDDFSEDLETTSAFEGRQNQSSDPAPDNRPQPDEPEQDFDQRFIESLCIDDDCDYESDDCPSACEDNPIAHLHESSAANGTLLPAVSIFDGSSLSVSASSLLIMQFKQRYKLTKEGLGDLLHLIRLHLPTPNQCPSSSYLFNKQFKGAKLTIILHYFCATCLQELPDKTTSHCPNDECARDLALNNGVASYIEVPIEQQLKSILERKL